MAPLAHTLALLAMTVATEAVKVLPLDMAQDSFDDQYRGCGPNMTAALPALNHSEFEQSPLFAETWRKATAEWQSRGSPVSPLSSPAQAIALMAYTMDDLYREFNASMWAAGRSSQEYRDNFHFKTLHFLLTQALVTLKDVQGPGCHYLYRGVRGIRFKARHDDIVRLGQFTLMLKNERATKDIGIDTMFHVETCQGVEIRQFSKNPDMDEVLIPPFETFQVVEVRQEKDWAWIQIHSRKNFSNYNCEWLRGGSVPRAPFHLGGLLLTTTALAVATRIL